MQGDNQIPQHFNLDRHYFILFLLPYIIFTPLLPSPPILLPCYRLFQVPFYPLVGLPRNSSYGIWRVL